MDNKDNSFIDFNGGCITWIGTIIVIWLVVKILPFLVIFL